MAQKYSTGQVAKLLGIHPNTVRWYENSGYVSSAERTAKGYRKFDDRHLTQLRICRIVFEGPYTNKKLRDASFAVLTALREEGVPQAAEKITMYKRVIKKEQALANYTADLLRKWMETGIEAIPTGAAYSRKEAAEQIDITVEVLRNWERNGLITVARSGRKNERVYGEKEMVRMRLIYMLRQNNYSVAAIHNSLTRYDAGDITGAMTALNKPDADPERVYLLAGDHWLEVLDEMWEGAKKMEGLLAYA